MLKLPKLINPFRIWVNFCDFFNQKKFILLIIHPIEPLLLLAVLNHIMQDHFWNRFKKRFAPRTEQICKL